MAGQGSALLGEDDSERISRRRQIDSRTLFVRSPLVTGREEPPDARVTRAETLILAE